jgi:hypothetical protein
VSATLYREFPLRNIGMWSALVAFVKANYQAVIDRGGLLRVIVTEDEKKRTSEQNRFFHGPVLDAITDQAWWEGRQYPKEFWKEYFRRRYLLKDEYTTPDGEIIQVYWSTADLKVGQMTEFLEKVQVESASEWGVVFE